MLIWIVTAACFLVACAPGGATSYSYNCSAEKEVCVTIDTAPAFAKGSPLVVKIMVTGSKDLAELYVTMITHGDMTMDGPQGWEPYISTPKNETGYAGWGFPIKAGQTRTFTRVLHFPAHAGYYDISVSVGNIGRTIDAYDDFSVVITNDHAGKIIKAGTPLPKVTPEITMAVYGDGTVAPTFVPGTMPWMAVPKPKRTQTPPVSTPMTSLSPYPAPGTSYP